MKRLNNRHIKNYISSIKFLLLFIIFTSSMQAQGQQFMQAQRQQFMQAQGQQFMQAQRTELINEINCKSLIYIRSTNNQSGYLNNPSPLYNLYMRLTNNQSDYLNSPSHLYNLGAKMLCHGKVEEGINFLKTASYMGHITASYLVGLYYKTLPRIESTQTTFQKPHDLHNAIHYYERANQQIKSAPFYPLDGPHIDTAYLEGNNSISAKIFVALPELYFDSYYEHLHTTINHKPASNQSQSKPTISLYPTTSTGVILPNTILKDMTVSSITLKGNPLIINPPVQVLSKMQKSAEQCLQKGLIYTFIAMNERAITTKKLTTDLNIKNYCEAMKDFAEQALRLESQLIKIAPLCHTLSGNCPLYKKIMSELQDLAEQMALYKTNFSTRY